MGRQRCQCYCGSILYCFKQYTLLRNMARLRLEHERVLTFIDWRSYIMWTAAVVDTQYKKGIQQLHIFSERRSETLQSPQCMVLHHTACSTNLHSAIGGLSFENWKTGCRLRPPFYSLFRYTNLVRHFRAQQFYSVCKKNNLYIPFTQRAAGLSFTKLE